MTWRFEEPFSLSENPGEPTCTLLGTEARSYSLLPVSSADAKAEMLGSESEMRLGDPGRDSAAGVEGFGSSIHLHVE